MAARNMVKIKFDNSEETLRCCFIPHLSAAFGLKGISLLTDKDDDICECNASLLIFSENYMSSDKSFDEVLKTIQRRHDKDHFVTAIFYRVSRSNVQELKGNFGKVFFEHRTSDQAIQWRNALADIESILGHEASNNQSDCDLVEKITIDVYEKIFPKERIGVYSRMLPGIVNVLCKQQWGVRSIGLWGMPGIGKTTLAKVLFDQMSGDYEVTCFLQNFHETFQKKGRHLLLEEHFKNLSNQKLQQRALVVLDDVRNHLYAESLLGGLGSFSHGSLIIVTSRDEQVLSQYGVNQTYKVEGLNNREAMQLFSWCAFERAVPEKDHLTELSMKVIEYANGNPLALRLYGEELSLKEDPNQKETWFLMLKQNPPQQIMEVVKSSYYALSDNEKNILVYIASFFTGEDVEHVAERLRDLGFIPEIGVGRLVENSLVTISENRLEMHSMIQDVVRKIGRCPQLETDEDPKTSLKCVLGTKDIEAISMDASDFDSHVKPSSLESMYNLIFLKIYYSNLENRHKAFESLPYRLRILHWEHYPMRSLPQDFDPSNLVELNMPYSQLQRLWGGAKNLKMLKWINLSHSLNLLEVEELSEARNLEQIVLCGCKNLQRFPSIRHLQKLRVVDLSGGTRIKNELHFPSNVELKFHGSSVKTVKTVPSPDTLKNKSLQERLESQEKSHFSDYVKSKSFSISQKRLTNPDMVESPPTFKDMMCQKAIGMGRSLQLRLTNLGIEYDLYKILHLDNR